MPRNKIALILYKEWLDIRKQRGLMLGMVLAPLIFIVLLVAISSRVNDPRTAQQISAVLILPVMILIFGQITGILVLIPLVAVIAAAILALFCAGVMALVSRLFQR